MINRNQQELEREDNLIFWKQWTNQTKPEGENYLYFEKKLPKICIETSPTPEQTNLSPYSTPENIDMDIQLYACTSLAILQVYHNLQEND